VDSYLGNVVQVSDFTCTKL